MLKSVQTVSDPEIEAALDKALQDLDPVPLPKAPGLLDGSRGSFEKHLQEIKAKIEAIGAEVRAKKQERARKLAQMDADLAALVTTTNAELFQLAVLEQALESALSSLKP